MKSKIILTASMLLALLTSCVQGNNNSANSNYSSNASDSVSSSNHSSDTSSNNGSSKISISPDIISSYDGDYYDRVDDNLIGDDLKRILSTITTEGFIGKSYDSLASIYATSDVVDGKMIMFYTNTARTFSTGSLPGKTNKEHVWPQSWYGSGSGTQSVGSPGADAHNIFPCDAQLNNVRSSYAFDVLPQTDGTRVYEGGSSGSYGEGGGGTLNYGTPGDPNSYNYTNKSTTFYPRAGYRGITARILMYVATRYFNDARYPVELVDEAQTSAQTGKYGRIGKLSTLLKWNLEEPPSDFEIRRNEIIYSDWHNNRNPFVDNPSFACRIWGNYNDNTRVACS